MNQGFIDKVFIDLERLEPRFNYLKLIALWSVLEAWMDETTGCDRTADSLNKVRSEDNLFIFSYADLGRDVGLPIINVAKRLDIKIKDAHNGILRLPLDNGSDIIAVIYEVRNKIIHGDWQLDYSLGRSDEKSMVHSCASVLEKWMCWSKVREVFKNN